MEAQVYHIPVMLQPSVDGLNIKPSGVYVDVTLGGGSHSREILSRLGNKGRLFSFDQDEDALSLAVAAGTQGSEPDSRWTLVRSNFRYLKNWMRYYHVEAIDGLLADLGVSSHHFDDASRGFSFRTNAALDMRMNKRATRSAADVVNTYSREQLASLFYVYGELRQARRIADAIVKARSQKEIRTTDEMVDLLLPMLGHGGDRRTGGDVPTTAKKELAKAFQALRIEVNQEMEALREMLNAATELLRPGGRLVVMSYHSLEDRMVKNLMRSGNVEGQVEQDIYGRVSSPLRPIGKPLTASTDEQTSNPRSRSAILRIAEKI
jgi:16S rRNA (cytosine1402-N4)-methyltransferase